MTLVVSIDSIVSAINERAMFDFDPRDRRFVGDEEARLLSAVDPYTKDLIVAALETGCRGGELRSLSGSTCRKASSC